LLRVDARFRSPQRRDGASTRSGFVRSVGAMASACCAAALRQGEDFNMHLELLRAAVCATPVASLAA
jgi:hypothetical protein